MDSGSKDDKTWRKRLGAPRKTSPSNTRPNPSQTAMNKDVPDQSHNGLKVIDSDKHIIEPADLWQRYIDPPLKDGAPAGYKSPFPRDISVILSHGMHAEHAGAQPHMIDWHRALRNHMKPLEHEYEFAARRNFDGVSQLEAMDREGIEVAFMNPSHGLFVLGIDSSETAGSKGIDWWNRGRRRVPCCSTIM